MKEELAGLKQRNAELEAQAREAEAALQENERLRNLLELQPKGVVPRQGRRHGHRPLHLQLGSTLTIGKGSAAGIAVDDCVVDEYAKPEVGVVAEVGENWATVRVPSLTRDTEMGGQLARTAARPSWRETLPSWGGQAPADLSAGEQRAHRRGSGDHPPAGRGIPPPGWWPDTWRRCAPTPPA